MRVFSIVRLPIIPISLSCVSVCGRALSLFLSACLIVCARLRATCQLILVLGNHTSRRRPEVRIRMYHPRHHLCNVRVLRRDNGHYNLMRWRFPEAMPLRTVPRQVPQVHYHLCVCLSRLCVCVPGGYATPARCQAGPVGLFKSFCVCVCVGCVWGV